MTKYCVAARIDERGRAVGGRAGDQSGSELNCHTLAGTGSWTYILRPPAKAKETMIKQAYNAAKNNHIGYDQNQRTTLFTQAKAKKWDLSKITTDCETDCSALIAVLANCAGLSVSKDMYTGNQVAALTKVGFTKIAYAESKLQRGDVIWRKGHTEIYVGTTKSYSAPKTTTTAKATTTKASSYTHKLIDVSKHNGVIDWAKVKKAGYHAILRLGYGDNIKTQDDAKFLYNAQQCEKLGIPYGAYIYSYAKSEKQISSEIMHAKRMLKGRKLSYPVYFDTEQSGTQSVAGKFAKKFCDAMEKEGYWAGIYASESWWNAYVKPTCGDRYTKWIAKYGTNNGKAQTKPNVTGTDIWQYSSKGKVDGVSGYVDVNIVYRDLVKAVTKKAAPY